MTMVKQYRDYANMMKEDQNMVGGFRCFGCDGDYDKGYWLEIQGEEPYFYCLECAEEAGIIGQPGVYEHGPNTVVEVVVLKTTEPVERFQLIIPAGDPKTAVQIATNEVEARGYNVIPGFSKYISVSGGEDYIMVTVADSAE